MYTHVEVRCRIILVVFALYLVTCTCTNAIGLCLRCSSSINHQRLHVAARLLGATQLRQSRVTRKALIRNI